LLLLATASCIDEDLSTCPSGIAEVSFGFSTQMGTSETLEAVNLYVFDSQGKPAYVHVFDEVEGGRQYLIDVNVPRGMYDIIVWSSQTHPYEVRYNPPATREDGAGDEWLNGKLFSLVVPPSRVVDGLLPPLFYGRLLNVELGDDRDYSLAVPMTENTNTLRITVTGLPDDVSCTFNVTDDNGAYYFDNSLAPCEPFTYTTRLTAGKNGLTGTTRVLRLGDDRSPQLELRDSDTGKLLYPTEASHTSSLVELIRTTYAQSHTPADEPFSFDLQHDYQLAFRFDASMGVSVDINRWIEISTEEVLE
jgi:hypothetical protein